MEPWSLAAAVVIIAIVCAVVVYAIKQLSSTPVRVATVIVAIATLVAVFPRLIDSLHPAPSSPPVPAEVSPGGAGGGGGTSPPTPAQAGPGTA
ncbi:hypothetical protein [Streptomyces sp. 021-4]|uniref:hypothetical protein n=1 Tax=Streptomyces sp. 021-4 TaxID=2789260 RepID=UPI0039F53358